MSDDWQPWGGGSRLGSYYAKRGRVVYERSDRAPLDIPCLRGVVTDDAAASYPMAGPEELPPPRSEYVPHRYR
jgi:hypothetical protein